MKIATIAIWSLLSFGTALAQQGAAPAQQPPRAREDEAATQAIVIPGPQLPYAATLGTLKWPSNANLVEVSTAGVAHFRNGDIIVFHRSEPGRAPLLVFDQNGKFLRAFGEEYGITRAHGLRVDADDNVWITDVRIQQVIKLDQQGKVLMTLGTKGKVGKSSATATLFNEPTDVGFDAAGNIYIANSHGTTDDPRIDKFDKNGKFLTTWRVEPKEGNTANVHTLAVAKDGTAFAAAGREHRTIRVYDPNGKLLRTLAVPQLVCGLYIDGTGQLWMTAGHDGQIVKLDAMTGKYLGVLGSGIGKESDKFGEAHYMTITPTGDILVADTGNNRVVRFKKK